jgi:hypothetical protein
MLVLESEVLKVLSCECRVSCDAEYDRVYQTTRCNIREHCLLRIPHRENLKSHPDAILRPYRAVRSGRLWHLSHRTGVFMVTLSVTFIYSGSFNDTVNSSDPIASSPSAVNRRTYVYVHRCIQIIGPTRRPT